MRSRTLGYVLAVVLGLIAGILGLVAHGGPLSFPIIGIVIAGLVVTSGAWLAIETWGRGGWLAYWLPEAGVTLWLLQAPPANDWVITSQQFGMIWLVLSVVLPFIPLLAAGKRRDREPGAGER